MKIQTLRTTPTALRIRERILNTHRAAAKQTPKASSSRTGSWLAIRLAKDGKRLLPFIAVSFAG